MDEEIDDNFEESGKKNPTIKHKSNVDFLNLYNNFQKQNFIERRNSRFKVGGLNMNLNKSKEKSDISTDKERKSANKKDKDIIEKKYLDKILEKRKKRAQEKEKNIKIKERKREYVYRDAKSNYGS